MAGARAGNDFTGEDELASQESRGAGDVAIGNFFANERAGNHFAAINYRRKNHDLEAVLRAQSTQEIYVTGLFVAKTEILSNEQGARAQVAKQNLLNKLFGREARQIQRERKHDGGFEPECAETRDALDNGGNLGRRGVRAQDGAGGGIKGQRGGHGVERASARGDGAQNGLMAEVDAVKAADGQHAALIKLAEAGSPRFGRGERGEARRLHGFSG